MDKNLITNHILDHGLGSRVLKMINIYGYVNLLNSKGLEYEYVHTPFSYEGFGRDFKHNQLWEYYHKPITNNQIDYLNICKKWDEILNYNGKLIFDYNESEVSPHIHPGFNGESELECFDHARKIKNIIKEEFNIPKKEHSDEKIINVHIRRGDVNQTNHLDRWLSDEYYLNCIEILLSKYPEHKVTIHTQRNGFNNKLFEDFKIVYDDEIDDTQSWLDLINSDILVIGKSAFSYSAGILCDGLVIYPSDDMFHTKLNEWKKIDTL
jgi:hypothetical protein